ncbi:MAG: DNA polymerase IV [Acidimicrobiales bacterium]
MILHVDMDAFFAAVEVLADPALRGKAVVVGGEGRRGVVAAASYEARAFGVQSAMPSVRARRLCPHAVFVPADHRRYAAVSARIMALFKRVTPLVEPLSLDEAFLDVTGARRLFGSGERIAARLRAEVLAAERLTCSVGVASNKLVAKLASEAAKPRATPQGPVFGSGVHVVAPGGELAFLHPLPVRALWGVGPATLAKLTRLGVATVGELAALPLPALVASLGDAAGRRLHALANGVDDRPVEPDREAKSIGHEDTFPHDLHDHEALGLALLRQADSVGARLRAHGLAARTITIKVRFGDFRTLTRSRTLPAAVDGSAVIAAAARDLLAALDVSPGVRLIGVSAGGLERPAARQLSFEEAADPAPGIGPAPPDRVIPDRVVDEIRARFGAGAIGPGSLVARRSPDAR